MDKNVVPNAGLSEDVAVLSLSLTHTERLLQKTPFTAGGVLAKTDRPLAAAVWFNWAGLLEAASPWIDYGLEQIDEPTSAADRAAVVDQIHVVLDVLKCYRGVTVESYLEDDYLVTHSLLEIHDVEEVEHERSCGSSNSFPRLRRLGTLAIRGSHRLLYFRPKIVPDSSGIPLAWRSC